MELATAQPLPAQPEKVLQNAEAKTTVAGAVGGHPSVLEPKYDGWRLLFRVGEDGKARCWTRSGIEQTGKMPAIEAEIARVFPPGSAIDGEVVSFGILNGVAVPRWGRVQSVLGSGTAKAALASGALTFVVFDLLAHGGIDARKLSFEKRREYLDMVFEAGAFEPCVQLTPQLEATDENHGALVEAGFEGSVVKWLDAPYKSGARGWGWFKLKACADVDVIVTGFKPGENGWVGLVGALVFGQYDEDGLIVERGRCSGMDFDLRVAISKDPGAYVGRVFSLRHMGLMAPTKATPHGAFRHPQFKTWREDKPAEAVTLHDA